MLVKVFSGTTRGIEAFPVSIEVNITQGIRFFIVGLADHAIRESQQRIESALTNNGFSWPRFRVVINLAPAGIRKEGTHFDLPLAIGILAATGQVETGRLGDFMAFGELSLDGGVVAVRGILPMVMMARREGFAGVLVPEGNVREAAVVEGIRVVPVCDLAGAVEVFNGQETAGNDRVPVSTAPANRVKEHGVDFSEVRGQSLVKRAMLIAAAGMHNILLVGPPGSGKSMMSRRLPTIMPPMSMDEALETTMVHSVAGMVDPREGLLTDRPFRSPHHTASNVALVGGGSSPRPGEISLAHHGVLFLDELPEFKRGVLEVLRQPLDDREIHVSRAGYRVLYPSDFMLVAAMNPCPCGYYTHPEKECHCGPGMIKQYLSRISGPLLDRIDMQVEVAPVPFHELSGGKAAESSEIMKNKVLAAQAVQQQRFRTHRGVPANSRMNTALRNRFCVLDGKGKKTLRDATRNLGLSVRAYDRILKVARTIADLEGSDRILSSHVAEAVNYRNLDREGWSG